MNIKIPNTTAIYCPFCGSMFVEHGKPITYDFKDMVLEDYYVVCQYCGAKGNITEKWEKEGVD